jgi:uncharacterized protein (DUF2147 family)
MMKAVRTLVFALLAFCPALANAGEAVHGVWLRGGHDETMEFYDCEGKLCARGELPLPDGSPPPLILNHAEKTAPNKWKGDLFNPEDGKLYPGTITLDNANQLTLTGCLIAFLCQSETWSRVVKAPTSKAPTAAASAPKTAAPAAAPASKTPAAAPTPKTAPPAASTKH